MPTKLKNLYPGKLPLPQLNLTSYDPQTIHYHQIQEDRLAEIAARCRPTATSCWLCMLPCRDLPNLDAWVELFRKTIPTYQKLAAADPSAKDKKSAEVSSPCHTFNPACVLASANTYCDMSAASSTTLC